MKDKLFGTIIPDAMINRMEQATDKIEEGILICAELIDQLQEYRWGIRSAPNGSKKFISHSSHDKKIWYSYLLKDYLSLAK